MTLPTILVTGATGKTGVAVVAQLREKGWPVRAVVHLRDGRSERLDRLGAKTVLADASDPRQLLEAMRGTARAYYLPPFAPYMIQGAVTFPAAARGARLEAGVGQTIINPGFFADNYLRLIGLVAHLGVLLSLTGDGRNAPPSNEGIARVAVAVLIDPARHAGKRYRPTGPALLSTSDMAVILGRVLGRKVRRLEMPKWLFLMAARVQGVRSSEMSDFRYWVEDQKRRAFETVARCYAALPEAKRSVGSNLRACADFIRTPLFPGYNLERFDRKQGFPVPAEPRFAMNDDWWRSERGAQLSRALNVPALYLGAVG